MTTPPTTSSWTQRATERVTKRMRPRTRFRRRVAGAVALAVGLITAGGLYTAFTPNPQVAQAQADAALIAQGQELYNNHCISCHGANLQGVFERGPSLIGAGDSSVYFQVATGRMPLARQEAQATRKPPLPHFDPTTPEGMANLDALGAFVQANGGGPERPAATGEALRGGDPARGGELFRLNCASCHNFVGTGIALSSGKYAPALDQSSEMDLFTAMQTGPQSMPKFSDRQLTPEEKSDIITYVKSVTNGNNSPGGNPLGGLGPTAEGAIIFLVGLSVMVGFALWMGAKQ